MHAILGLGASHLTAISEGDYHAAAIKHRILAIKGFNEALSATSSRDLDDDALLGACYALSFQSTYMKDGAMPGEYLTMLRGCGLVTTRVMTRKSQTFFALTPEDHYKFMMPRLQNLPIIDADLFEAAGSSLELLEMKVRDGVNRFFFNSLVDIVEGLRIGSLQGYLKYISLLQALGILPQTQFNQFVAPTNTVAPFLLAHLFGLQVILTPVLSRTWEARKMISPVRHRMDLVQDLYNALPEQEQMYMKWPVKLARRVSAEVDGNLTERARTILTQTTNENSLH